MSKLSPLLHPSLRFSLHQCLCSHCEHHVTEQRLETDVGPPVSEVSSLNVVNEGWKKNPRDTDRLQLMETAGNASGGERFAHQLVLLHLSGRMWCETREHSGITATSKARQEN